MNITYDILQNISEKYGDSFYILDKGKFKKNFCQMQEAFRKYYSNTYIAYSYKTNYIPDLCSSIMNMGGWAEVVSEMELNLALKIGVVPENIFFNGPYKKQQIISKVLDIGANINIDAFYEAKIIREIALKNQDKEYNIGIRFNLDIGQDIPSRFGFDVNNDDLSNVLDYLRIKNINIIGLHTHLPYRDLDSFIARITALQSLFKKLPCTFMEKIKYVSVGGGYKGKIREKITEKYDDYAKVVAQGLSESFKEMNIAPNLIIEPGTAIVADAINYVVKIINIKDIKGTSFVSTSGSIYNMNPSTNGFNRPIRIYHAPKGEKKTLKSAIMTGYTCIEKDYLYSGYDGELGVGDYCVFENAGSYSINMKPRFIMPDVPILEFKSNGELQVIRKMETEIQVFENYTFFCEVND